MCDIDTYTGTDRQTDIRDRKRDRQTDKTDIRDRQTDRKRDRQTDRHMGQTDRHRQTDI